MNIRLLALDCDGVLTDGSFYLNDRGEPVRRFNFRDIMGLSLAQRSGIRIAVLTAEPIARGLQKKLDIRHLYSTVKHPPVIIRTRDKAGDLKRLADRYGIPLKDIAMIGDDVNDLPAINLARFSACPQDAHPTVKKRVNYVCRAAGGHGAVREICDRLTIKRKPF